MSIVDAIEDYTAESNYDNAEREAYHRWVEAGKPARGIAVNEVVNERLAEDERRKQRPLTPSLRDYHAQRRINRRKSSGH